jgi:soluble P-type ATPase
VALVVDIPGGASLRLEHLLLDVNGTLTDRGVLVAGVAERLAAIAERLDVRILSADTFGTLDDVAGALGLRAERVRAGADKARVAVELGHCAAIGNGLNDAAMLEAAALGIAVVGPEGASGAVVRTADVLCASILDALDLLLDERALAATVRP